MWFLHTLTIDLPFDLRKLEEVTIRNNELGYQKRTNQGTSSQPKPQTTKDKKIIKIFLAITLLYIFSFFPQLLVLLHVSDSLLITFTYFMNHFGNAIIYYIFDDAYQKEVKRVILKAKCC